MGFSFLVAVENPNRGKNIPAGIDEL